MFVSLQAGKIEFKFLRLEACQKISLLCIFVGISEKAKITRFSQRSEIIEKTKGNSYASSRIANVAGIFDCACV
jgi:hypothetical protein